MYTTRNIYNFIPPLIRIDYEKYKQDLNQFLSIRRKYNQISTPVIKIPLKPSLDDSNQKIYYCNNEKKIRLMRSKSTSLFRKTLKGHNEPRYHKEIKSLDLEHIINPLKIKNLSNQKFLISSIIKGKRFKSVSCEMSSNPFRSTTKIPFLFNGYMTKYRQNKLGIIINDPYMKPKVNLDDIIINQKSNQIKALTRTRIEFYQIKKSMLLLNQQSNINKNIREENKKFTFVINNSNLTKKK